MSALTTIAAMVGVLFVAVTLPAKTSAHPDTRLGAAVVLGICVALLSVSLILERLGL